MENAGRYCREILQEIPEETGKSCRKKNPAGKSCNAADAQSKENASQK